MDYKRIEMYVWWTCNQKCTYCMEYPNMEESWNKRITKFDILKKLLKYKKLWYNHVTYLWWEPFIQWVFLDALKIWKKLWYKILVTTNATTLHLKKEAKKFLPYINELILSVEAIDKNLQQKISRTNVYVKWDKVFKNIKNYWKWNFLKINIVITKDNLKELLNIIKYLNKKKVKNIAITYPDIDIDYYWKSFTLDKISPSYKDCMKEIIKILKYSKKNNLYINLADFPFCIFPKENLKNYINISDDLKYWNRVKVADIIKENDKFYFWELNRENVSPRERKHIKECTKCLYKNKCWWPSKYYKDLYWLKEIKAIKD